MSKKALLVLIFCLVKLISTYIASHALGGVLQDKGLGLLSNNLNEIKTKFYAQNTEGNISGENEKRIIDRLIVGAKRYERNINLKGIDLNKYKKPEDTMAYYKKVGQKLYQNCSLEYISTISYTSNRLFSFEYKKDTNTLYKEREKMDAKVNQIINSIILPQMTDIEKERAIHNYLVTHVEFDSRAFQDQKVDRPDSFEAYGAINLGNAVCEGYAKAFRKLCTAAGIECFIITGIADKVEHAWNIVRINGQLLHVDVTWDDPVAIKSGTSKKNNKIDYSYFNLTSEKIKKDHFWDYKKYPELY